MTDICSNDNMTTNIESNIETTMTTNIENELNSHIHNNNITVSDEDENFILEHFKECNDNSDPIVKECRGIIKLKSSGEVVCKTFPFTPEILFGTDNLQNSVEDMCNKGASFYPSFEGTVLRVWNHNDNWYLSTHRKIDANKSRWGSNLTFKQRFIKALQNLRNTYEPFSVYFNGCPEEELYNKYLDLILNKDYIYTFLLRTSSETRIVCSYETEDLFYVGSFSKVNFEFNSPDKSNILVPTIPKLNINCFEDFIIALKDNKENVNNCWSTQGLIAVSSKGESVKYMNPEYVKWCKVRGNEPILVQAYINKIKSGSEQDLQHFLFLYQYNQDFKEYEYIMHDVKRNILNNYIRRYIHKKIVAAPPEQHKVLVHLYQTYLKNRRDNVLNHQWIDEQVNRLPTVELYNLYKQYKYRREHFGNGNTINEDVIKRTNDSYYKTNCDITTSV